MTTPVVVATTPHLTHHDRTTAMLSNGPPLSALRSLDNEDRLNKPLYAQRSLLHRVACEQGAYCYQDPITNDLVATSIFLTKFPQFVTDIALERHCPYSLIEAWEEEQHQKHQKQSTSEKLAGKSTGEEYLVDSDDEDDDLSVSSSDDDDEESDATFFAAKLLAARALGSASLVDALANGASSGDGGAARDVSGNGAAAAAATSTSNTGRPMSSPAIRFNGPATRTVPMSLKQLISPFSREHSAPLRVSDLPDMEDILALPKYAQAGRLHKACVQREKDCYIEPTTGLTTFTRPFLEKAPCCGESCRHCPYGHSACRSEFSTSARDRDVQLSSSREKKRKTKAAANTKLRGKSSRENLAVEDGIISSSSSFSGNDLSSHSRSSDDEDNSDIDELLGSSHSSSSSSSFF